MNGDNSMAIRMESVCFSYGDSPGRSLQDFYLTVPKGECVLLCGESGCGKTSVTRLVNGLIPHYYEGNLSGCVEICGHDPQAASIDRLAGVVGSVFQNPRSQFFCVDTTSEIAFGCENMGLPEEEIRHRVAEVGGQMGLEPLLGRSIFQLSGGEKQKIACAGVYAMEPEVFVLDEPTSNLDQAAIENLREILLLWKVRGKTILIAEHRLDWLKDVCDRVVYLKDGTNAGEYDAETFFGMGSDRLHQLGLRAGEEDGRFLSLPPGLHELPTGSGNEPQQRKSPSESETLELTGFSYRYGKRQALDIPRLTVPLHSVVAVVGHNGAGKSTLAGCLCGLKKGFHGSVQLGGKQYRGKALCGLSYMVMQDVNHQLFTESVLEEVILGMETEDENRAIAILKQLDLEKVKDRHPMSLSGGQKQRTAIASAYATGKSILVMDEPTSGLDYRHMLETAELIRSVRRNKPIFIVTHDMELVKHCCTHILRMERGGIQAGDSV